MRPDLDDVCCARLPAPALAALARLRCEPDLRAARAADHVWLRWDAGNERVLRAVLPLPGVALFAHREGRWYPFGRALPVFDLPAPDYRPLAHVLFPAPLQAVPPPRDAAPPVTLTVRPDARPRPARAALCPLAALLAWADTVPAPQLAELEGLFFLDQILVLGDRLPLFPDGTRYWGRDVLVPLGYAPDPDLPESALRAAAGVTDDEILLMGTDHAEAVPRELLRPLSRAGLRLAAGEAA
jgi:hypothetical protein